jgi:poly-gamma-glutamate synthesis protein (capsule biosynthesis protein)
MPPARHARPSRSPRAFAIFIGALVVVIIGSLVVRAAIHHDEAVPSKAQPRTNTPTGPIETSTPASPATSSPASKTTTPSPEHRGTLVIHGAGDTNVEPGYIGVSPSNYDFMLSGMKGLFVKDDLTVVNLECSVTRIGTPVPKEFNFQGDPDALPYLKRGGVDVANIANNHSYDYGPEALVDTRQNIEKAGLAAVGAGKDPAEAEEPAIFHVKGWTIAVVGIDKVVDPYPEAIAAPGHPGTACGHDVNCMVREVRRAAQLSNLTIVDIHWGVELDTTPRSDDVTIAHRLVAAGADIIFGGHSHRLQPLDLIDGKPVFWSLGNFVWPHLSVEGSTTAVGDVVVKPNGKITAKLLPVYIDPSGHPVLTG